MLITIKLNNRLEYTKVCVPFIRPHAENGVLREIFLKYYFASQTNNPDPGF